jgi:hypothetical protein
VLSNVWYNGQSGGTNINPPQVYVEPGAAAPSPMSLVATNSAATLLDFTPTEGRLGMWIEETAGTLVLNDNVAGYLCRDDAHTNWVRVTFDGRTAYATNVGHYVWSSAVTNLPGTGSNLLWRVDATTNRAGRIRGVFPQAR